MKKSALLVIFSLMLGSLFLFKPINSASAQSTQPEYNPNPFCSFTPNGAATGNVTLANSCVIYEDINGVANGNLTINPSTSVTLHHNLVFYPGYKITVSPGAKIFVNSDSKIQQGVICIKKGVSGYPVVKTVTGNLEASTGATITSSALAQMDAVYAATSSACNTVGGYYPRETFTSLAYVDTGLGATSFSTSDADMLGLGFTINGVTSTLAAAGDIQVDPAKNLILLPGGAGGKLGIGITNPTNFLTIGGVTDKAMRVMSSTGNSAFFGVYQDSAAMSANRDTTTGTIIDATKASAEISATAKASDSYLIFGTTPTNNSAPIERMRIINSGNVGVGDTAPSQKFTVNGGIGFANTNDTDKKLYAPADGDLEWMTNSAAGVHGFAVSNQGTKQVYLNTSGNSYFTGGNLGVGINAPNGRLEVNSGTGDGIVFGQVNGDNTDSIQAYIDGQWASRATYASGCCNMLYIQHDAGDLSLGNARGVSTVGSLSVGGNLTLTPSNPSIITGGSYVTIPNGMYISGASIPLYTEARIQARGGISNDTGTSLNIYGGTSGNTQFSGTVGITAANTVAYPVIINSTVSSAETAAVQINANNSGLASIYGYALEVNNSDNNTFNGAIKANYKGTNASWSSAVYGTNSANGSGAFGVVGSASYGTGGWFQTSTGTALRVDGKMTVASGEIISTNNNQFRLVWGNYGLIFRQDGTTFYMLPTNSGDQYGSWNALRPFAVTMATGYVTFGNGHNDLAELFSVSGKVVKGSIVSIDTSKPKSAIASNDKNSSIIGVVSTTPGAVMNPDGGFHIGYESKDKYENEKTPIALVGTAPTLVTTQKGGISIGDSIAFSSLPGYGAKAVEAGNTVGKAQEAFDPATLSCPSVSSVDAIKWIDDDGMNSKKPCYKLPDGTFVGKIMIYINPSWFDAGSKVATSRLEEQQKQIDRLNATNSLQAQKIQDLQTAVEALQQKVK